MAGHKLTRISVPGLLLVVAGVGGYLLWRPAPEPQIVGVVHTTEGRAAAEVGGQLAAIKVHKGDRVRAGDRTHPPHRSGREGDCIREPRLGSAGRVGKSRPRLCRRAR